MLKPDPLKYAIDAIIIDDEPASADLLGNLLEEFKEIRNISSFNCAIEGMETIQKQKPDLVFLDLDLPRLNGIEIMRLLNAANLHVHVILISGHKNMILEAAHYGVIDYLLKPFSRQELARSIEKYKRHKEQHSKRVNLRQEQKIRIPTSFEELFFEPEEISYIEADGAYTQIYLANDKKITSSYHLKRIQALLPADKFIRISRKHIINYAYLFKIDKKGKQCMLNHKVKFTALPYSKAEIVKAGLIPE